MCQSSCNDEPPKACWWGRSLTRELYVVAPDGHLRMVPSSSVERDYDFPLALPYSTQSQLIWSAQNDAPCAMWPPVLDPKAVVVLSQPNEGKPPKQRHFWFVRLSMTPHILRRLPPSVVQSITQALQSSDRFSNSTLLTEYPDCREPLSIDAWMHEREESC